MTEVSLILNTQMDEKHQGVLIQRLDFLLQYICARLGGFLHLKKEKLIPPVKQTNQSMTFTYESISETNDKMAAHTVCLQ